MKSIRVRIPRGKPASYPIRIGRGLLGALPDELSREFPASTYIVLTDTCIQPLFGNALREGLERRGRKTLLVALPPGEPSKTRESKSAIEDRMLEAGMGRDSVLLALGGGVVGDLGGFVAATYCRGIPFFQIPTTLLAMVDSSIGGKTGVDHPAAKNWIGAYHQPSGVIMDVGTLKSLPDRQLRCGLAEVVKTGIIADPGLFRLLESRGKRVLERDEDLLVRIVERCCRVKSAIVRKDERESGLREILNFGHTLGHALEKVSGYRIPHGEAVAIGMILECRVAVEMGRLSAEAALRTEKLLEGLGLPVAIPPEIDLDALQAATRLDKKAREGKARYVLPEAIGRVSAREGSYSLAVPPETIRKVLRWSKSHPIPPHPSKN